MMHSGNIKKMQTNLVDGLANYQLPIGDDLVFVNDLIGSKINLQFNNEINCLNCGVKTNKSYSQGYCYMCSQTLACCDLCIMKPETCHHHLGTCRQPMWGLDNCFTSHIIYLANSSGVKVGITRKINIPSRFIDQGAVEFLPILEVDSRIKSGKIEHSLKEFIADKTNWRAMLKNELNSANLLDKKSELLKKIPNLINDLAANILDITPTKITYPVLEYPSKITSLNFDKISEISGKLLGIKGQYLILESGVLNIRKFGGYSINLEY